MSNRTVSTFRRRRLAYWALASILVANAYILSIPSAITRIPSRVEDYISYRRGKRYYGDTSIAPFVERTAATERYFLPGPHSGVDGDGPWRAIAQWPPNPLLENKGLDQCMSYKVILFPLVLSPEAELCRPGTLPRVRRPAPEPALAAVETISRGHYRPSRLEPHDPTDDARLHPIPSLLGRRGRGRLRSRRLLCRRHRPGQRSSALTTLVR